MNTFGIKLRLSTFGESHGKAIGGMLDGFPAGVKIDMNFLKNEMQKRRPGGKFATSRKEDDEVEILSGVFDGVSTGAPIGFVIYNSNQHSKDYENLKDLFRPGHADFGYFCKYGIRDYRGGGRSSARETAIRVAGGAFSQMLLNEFNISVKSGVLNIGEIKAKEIDFKNADNSEIFSLDKNVENSQKELIKNLKDKGESVGSVVMTVVEGVLKGLGEVLYAKTDGLIGGAFMGINGVKAVEIGDGIQSALKFGSQNNDCMNKNGFYSNHAGGILGGITNGENIIIKTHFKPTPSIFAEQPTVDKNNNEVICALRGRHDPCIGVRGSVVCTAMARLVMADLLLLNASANLDNLKKIYG